MSVGRGQGSTWILKISVKGCFLSFEWEKLNFTTFGPLENFFFNPLATLLQEKFFRGGIPWL